MTAANHVIAAVNTVFGPNTPLPLTRKAEDTYYAANSCDWLEALLLAYGKARHIVASRPTPVTIELLQDKLA